MKKAMKNEGTIEISFALVESNAPRDARNSESPGEYSKPIKINRVPREAPQQPNAIEQQRVTHVVLSAI